MAKCVIMLNGSYEGQVIRVTDGYAKQLCNEGRAEYRPKEAWKESGRIHPKDKRLK